MLGHHTNVAKKGLVLYYHAVPGKSCLMAYMAKRVTDKGGFVLLIMHRKELQQQLTNTFTSWGVNMDLCLIGMVQSMKKHLGKIPAPMLIIVEECHHTTSKTYRQVLDYYPTTKGVFFTATPLRLNQGGLGDVCDDLLVGVTAEWLIENKYLAPYTYYSINIADLTGLQVKFGDYDKAQLAELLDGKKIYGDAVQHYKKLAEGKKTIIYCSSVEASKGIAKEFRDSGYTAESLDGKTDIKKRLEVMDQFRNGEIQILTNFSLFGEGLDIPDCDCVILLRKTKSLTLYIQMAMRCLRRDPKNPNKQGIIIDHAGNIFEHDFPTNTHEWSLQTKKQKEQNEISIKTCPNCFSVMLSNTLICPTCGTDFTKEVKERQEKERVQAELEEIKRLEVQKLLDMPYKEVTKFQTWDELDKYREVKKYHIMWGIRQALQLGIPIPAKYHKLKERIQ